MKLPVEVSLHALGFLDRQTLGQAMVANYRLSATVNRYRKILNLLEIPVPPRLSISLKLGAFLAFVTLLLLPVGISFAQISTEGRLRAAGLVPESVHQIQKWDLTVPSTATCDSQQQCHAECAFQHTLLGEKIKGTITTRNCSNLGLPATNASLATPVGWNCSFDYVSKKAAVDFKAREMILGRHWITWFNLFVGVFHLMYAVRVLRTDRTIADDYMAAIHDPQRDRIRREHEALRKGVIGATVIASVFVGLYGFGALFGMTLQSFSAVDAFFGTLFGAPPFTNCLAVYAKPKVIYLDNGLPVMDRTLRNI
ncbi:hypothetical protein AAVH_08981 [Aphelenchoides avenae]|nr:hypothetical protein AAVH_08981 [Aphelenchus avenae]